MFTQHTLRSLRLITVLAALTFMISSLAFAPSANAKSKNTWTNCGDYVCTTYISKQETKVWAEYFEALAPLGKASETVLCGTSVLGLPAAKSTIPRLASEITCETFFATYGPSAWHSASQRAVDKGGCLQIEKRHKGKIRKPGWTTHRSYCMP